MATRAAPMRWRKRKRDIRYRSPEAFELVRQEAVLAVVQYVPGEGAWFWYGAGMNTADLPTDLATAKAAAVAHARKTDGALVAAES